LADPEPAGERLELMRFKRCGEGDGDEADARSGETSSASASARVDEDHFIVLCVEVYSTWVEWWWLY